MAIQRVDRHLASSIFIPPGERASERPFRVALRPDNSTSQARYLKLLAEAGAIEDDNYPVIFIRLRAFVMEWWEMDMPRRDEEGKPILDAAGEIVWEPMPIPLGPDGNVTTEGIDCIPQSYRLDINREIEGITGLTEEDRKNSV